MAKWIKACIETAWLWSLPLQLSVFCLPYPVRSQTVGTRFHSLAVFDLLTFNHPSLLCGWTSFQLCFQVVSHPTSFFNHLGTAFYTFFSAFFTHHNRNQTGGKRNWGFWVGRLKHVPGLNPSESPLVFIASLGLPMSTPSWACALHRDAKLLGPPELFLTQLLNAERTLGAIPFSLARQSRAEAIPLHVLQRV